MLDKEFLHDLAVVYMNAMSRAYKANNVDAIDELQVWAKKNHNELMQAQENEDKKYE